MNIKAGLIAGFFATVVLSILMVVKAKMGIMPDLNAIKMLAGMMGAPLIMGWVAHFMIGTVIWGLLFAALVDKLPGSILISAIIFSIGAWLTTFAKVCYYRLHQVLIYRYSEIHNRQGKFGHCQLSECIEINI